MSQVVIPQRGPHILVRAIWWLFVGSWLSAIIVAVAWFALITIIGIPLGIYLINRLPTVLTLRPRTASWTLGADAQGRQVWVETKRSQVTWWLRGVWFLVVGWWASAAWMALAWLVQWTIIGIPIALAHVQPDAVRRVAVPVLRRRPTDSAPPRRCYLSRRAAMANARKYASSDSGVDR